jgi:hypothetical protein
MPNPIVVVADWFGPYRSLEKAKEALRDYGGGLYMLIGRKNGKGKHKKGIRYCGISDELSGRVNNTHSIIKSLDSRMLIIWFGEITCTQKSNALGLVEWAHIYFLELPENKNKKKNPPSQPVTVLNRWWKTDYTLVENNAHTLIGRMSLTPAGAGYLGLE